MGDEGRLGEFMAASIVEFPTSFKRGNPTLQAGVFSATLQDYVEKISDPFAAVADHRLRLDVHRVDAQ
jgi:hypothetical protein